MTGVFGGGVIFVVAALLWAAVLVPSWVRRREFKAAERNAVRLQRTLRVLAETAEVPTEVRVEATAREALAHERLLRTAKRQQEAERQADLAEARAAQVRAEMKAQQMRRKQAAITRAARLRMPMVRRLRAFAALCAVLAIAGVLVGVGFLAAGQGVTVLACAGLVLAASVGGLTLMAPGRVKIVEIPEERIEPGPTSVTVPDVTEVRRAASESAAAHAEAQASAAARIERARAMARARAQRPLVVTMRNQPESMLLTDVAHPREAAASAVPGSRSSESADTSTRVPGAAPTAREAAVARIRGMGVVGDTSAGMLDLDAALRSRRNAS